MKRISSTLLCSLLALLAAVLTSLAMFVLGSSFKPNMLLFWPFWFGVVGLALAYALPVVAAMALTVLITNKRPSVGLAVAICCGVIGFEVVSFFWRFNPSTSSWRALFAQEAHMLPLLLVPAVAFFAGFRLVRQP
jgi:hypothetical protein